MVSIRIDVALWSVLVVAAAAMWPMEVIATITRPAKLTPATATLCLFMGTGTRFACKIRLFPSVSEVPPVRATRYGLCYGRLMIGRMSLY
jgi:hypothetical protein